VIAGTARLDRPFDDIAASMSSAPDRETDYARINRAHGDPYRILGVERDATTDEVRSAYKRLVRPIDRSALLTPAGAAVPRPSGLI